jgi:four helix bundle protein
MAFKFEDLRIWRISLELCNEIERLTKYFPKTELFSLSSQIKRAAESVNLNIAEGSTSQSNKEFARFLSYALRSALEVVSCLYIAVARNYIQESEFRKLYYEYDILCTKISSLRKSLNI